MLAVVAMLLTTVFVVVAPSATAQAETAPARFVPVRPCRLLDTRESPAEPLAAGKAAKVQVADRCGVGGNAVAAAITLTAIGPDAPGYATVFPTGSERPVASAINYAPGETIANMQLVQLGSGGAVSVYTLRSAHFVVDVTGYFEPTDGPKRTGRYVPIETYRAVDTRQTQRPSRRSAVNVRPQVPADAIAVAVTITTTDTRSPGFFTAYAADQQRPVASVLNSDAAGQTRSASAIVPVSEAGFKVYTQAGDHVIVDVTGYFTGRSAERSSVGLFVATTPTRLVDTRLAASPSGGPRLWDRGTREFDPGPITGGPVGAIAANITVTNTEDSGYVVAYPSRTKRPLASNVNYDSASVTVATSSIVRTSTAGVAVHALEATHLIIDVTGWFTGTPIEATGAAAVNQPPPDRRVTIISDSTMAGIRWNGALAGLQGFQPVTKLDSCRRLVQYSCRGREGFAPPTVVAELNAMAPVGPEEILLIATGYDDYYPRFSSDFDIVVATARARGFHHIVWATFVVSTRYRQPGSLTPNYIAMNGILADKIASGNYPDVRLWDLDSYVAGTSGWFYSDGIHETPLGSWGIADWVSRHVRAFDDRPCAQPLGPGRAVQDPCPNPDLLPHTDGLPDIVGLYGL